MSESEKQMWLTNIVELADRIATAMGQEMVTFVLQTYGADCIDELDPGKYCAVFADLQAIEANLG